MKKSIFKNIAFSIFSICREIKVCMNIGAYTSSNVILKRLNHLILTTNKIVLLWCLNTEITIHIDAEKLQRLGSEKLEFLILNVV